MRFHSNLVHILFLQSDFQQSATPLQQVEQNPQTVLPQYETLLTVKAVEASGDESNKCAAMVVSDSDSKGAYHSIYNVCICLILVFFFYSCNAQYGKGWFYVA